MKVKKLFKKFNKWVNYNYANNKIRPHIVIYSDGSGLIKHNSSTVYVFYNLKQLKKIIKNGKNQRF